jgi:hypothetical protein
LLQSSQAAARLEIPGPQILPILLVGGREVNALFEGVLPAVHVFNEQETVEQPFLLE